MAMSKKKREENLKDWLYSLPDEFITCRDLRHAWGGSQTAWAFGHGFHGRVLVCARCGVRKEQMIDRSGNIVVSKMVDYPSDYVKPADTPQGRVPSTLVRDESVGRAVSTKDVPKGLTGIFDHMTGKTKRKPVE